MFACKFRSAGWTPYRVRPVIQPAEGITPLVLTCLYASGAAAPIRLSHHPQYNYLEHAATAISCHLMAGLVYPQFATATAVAYILGREIYTHGYLQDPSKRAPGAVIVDLALVAMFGGAMTSGARIAGLIKL